MVCGNYLLTYKAIMPSMVLSPVLTEGVKKSDECINEAKGAKASFRQLFH